MTSRPAPRSDPRPSARQVPYGWRPRLGWTAALLVGSGILVAAVLAGGDGSRAGTTSSNRWTLLAVVWFVALAVWAWFLPSARGLLLGIATALAAVTVSGLPSGGPFPSNVVQLFGVPLLSGMALIGVLGVPPTASGVDRPLPGLLRGMGIALAVAVAGIALLTLIGVAGF